MVSKDFKTLLQQYASALFELHNAMQALKYSPYHQPILRYYRGQQSDFELYWCNNVKSAPLDIVWATPYGAPLVQPPAEIQAKAIILLQELDSQRELVALYRCGYFEGDRFVLSSWLIPFPSSYEPSKGEGSGVYYTVTKEGVLGLAGRYANNKKLCAELL